MPILFILFVVATCLPIPWPPPPLGYSANTSALLTAAVTIIPLGLTGLLSWWVVRTLHRDASRRSAVAARYGPLRRALSFAHLAMAALAVLGCGWGWTVWHGLPIALDRPGHVLVPGGELLVPAPYFLATILGWVIAYPAERAFHRAAADARPDFWSFPAYFLFQFRQFFLTILLPVGLMTIQLGISRAAPEWSTTTAYQIASIAFVAAVFVGMPRLVKPLLGLTPMPHGPTRDLLEATARRLGVGLTDILYWPTRGGMANAMVVGVVRWARYVIVTDRLVERLTTEELVAVFGHEAGHVRHKHIPYYAGFFALSATTATAAVAVLEQLVSAAQWEAWESLRQWSMVPPVAGLAGYLFVVFGYLSRQCERQADVYGSRAGSCGNPGCTGHDTTTVLVAHGRGLCRTGAMTMVHALDRVAHLNGISSAGRRGILGRIWTFTQAWQHGPFTDRIEFLLRVSEDPSLGDRTDRRVVALRIGLAVALLATLASMIAAVGWQEFLQML